MAETNYANIAQAIAIIAQTVAAIGDRKRQIRFSQTLELFSQDQQLALSEKLMRAQTQTARIEILIKTIADFETQQQKLKDSRDVKMTIVAAGLAALLLGVSLFYVLKHKS